MSPRNRPFPKWVMLISGLCVGLGVIWTLKGQADWLSGWCVGWGAGNAMCALMVWASPLNEARR